MSVLPNFEELQLCIFVMKKIPLDKENCISDSFISHP